MFRWATKTAWAPTKSLVPNIIDSLARRDATGGSLIRPEEAQVGKKVRVHESLHRADLKGKEGTITAKWGSPDYVALDVELDDGRSQLFWYHELEEAEDGARS